MGTEAETEKTTKIFCCYAHADKKLWRAFEEHLALLEHIGRITKWHEGNIRPGARWEEELEKFLTDASIILLFLSSSFLSSTCCYRLMQQALEIRRTKKVPIIPILLRPVSLKELPIGQLKPLPNNEKPVTRWKNRDEAFQNIVQGINIAINTPVSNIEDTELQANDDFSAFFEALFRENYNKNF